MNSVQKQQALVWCWLDFAAAGSNRSSHQSNHGGGCMLQLVSLAQWKHTVTTSSKTAHCQYTKHLSVQIFEEIKEWDDMLWFHTRLYLGLFLLPCTWLEFCHQRFLLLNLCAQTLGCNTHNSLKSLTKCLQQQTSQKWEALVRVSHLLSNRDWSQWQHKHRAHCFFHLFIQQQFLPLTDIPYC